MERPASIGIVYSFDHFRLDKPGRQLVRQDTSGKAAPVLLGTRALDVLLALVERSGEVVSKAEILDAVWPGLAVEEVNLTVQISAVRRAIDRERDGPSLIRTIHGRGYLFTGAVTHEVSSLRTPWAEKLVNVVSLSRSTGPRTATDYTEANHDLPERREPERRQITAINCEIVELAVLSTRLDPEDLREVTTACHLCCTDIIERHRGCIANYTSSGVLAYFGYPQADEHDVGRAVRAGLRLVHAMPKLATAAGAPLHARIGVATGLVVASSPSGSQATHTATVIGDTPNLAIHLQTLAQPDMVLVSEATRAHLGQLFKYRHVGAIKRQGVPIDVPAWQVMSENSTLGRFEALRSGATPLVGRDEELELLLRRWAQAKAGNGRVVLISAEPGVGKSRLAEALAERIAAERHIRLRYFCSPHHQDSALYPVITQMEKGGGFEHSDSVAARLAKLQALLAITATPVEDMALIAELHALPTADLAPALHVTPQRKMDKTIEALLRQVESLARQQPLLVVFDDIHWIDPSSRELLARTMERVAAWPVLLLALFRPEFQPPWSGQPHVTTLTLARLDRQNTAMMVASVAGDVVLPPEIFESIVDRSDGVPLFVEELTKMVLESDAPGARGSSMTHTQLPVPMTLHASLMARLDRLGSAAREIAQTGAAIGRAFEHQLLASVTDMSEPQLLEVLDRLIDAGLLFARGPPPDSSYLFKHALVQDAAYGTLLRGRRQRLHARIASVLEDRFAEIVLAQPALLAHHCTSAGLVEKAIVYWLRASRQALARSAMTEAVVHSRRGLDALTALPDSSWRLEQELDFQTTLGSALTAMKGWGAAEVGENLARSRLLAEQTDRPASLVALISAQWAFHCTRAEPRKALALGEELETIGGRRDDLAAQWMGRFLQGISRFFLGEFVPARRLLERLTDPANPAIRGLPVHALAGMLPWLALTLAYLGYVDQARARLDEALSEGRRIGHAHTLAHVLCMASWLDWVIDSPATHTDETVALATEYGFRFYVGWALAHRGRLLVELGQPGLGLALLTQGLADLRASEGVNNTPMLLTWVAEAHALVGTQAESRAYFAEAARIIEISDERLSEAELLHRVPGDIAHTAGDQSAAERCYHQAIAVAERQSAKLFQLRASTSLARLWRDQGKRSEARDLLARIYSWFTEGFDAPDLECAKALLDELA